jgi:RNA polymerase sigma-70 factor (ECF subfamily)
MVMTDSKQISNAEFAARYAAVQRTLYAYLFTLVPNAADADDVMQETAAALWTKADEYDPDQPFLNWAMTFARFQAMKFRKYSARHRSRTVALSDAVVDALADTDEFAWNDMTRRAKALEGCLAKLQARDQELVQSRYCQGSSIHAVAGHDERLAARLYKRLQRIRQLLADCIRHRLAET